jgi:hypothetical protein
MTAFASFPPHSCDQDPKKERDKISLSSKDDGLIGLGHWESRMKKTALVRKWFDRLLESQMESNWTRLFPITPEVSFFRLPTHSLSIQLMNNCHYVYAAGVTQQISSQQQSTGFWTHGSCKDCLIYTEHKYLSILNSWKLQPCVSVTSRIY